MHTVAGENMLVAIGEASRQFNGIVKLNETAAFIVEQLQSETTVGEIAAALKAAYEIDEETAAGLEHDVEAVIASLKEVNAIEE